MNKNLIANKKIAIVGGGPVGLMAARLLQMKGAVATVYERDKTQDARMLGGSIDLHKNTGQKALEKARLLDKFYEKARPTSQRMADKFGNILMEMMPDQASLYDEPEIDRPDLRKILLESLTENTVVWDRQVIGIDIKTDCFELHFQNGSTAFSELVIVADGSRSRTRKYVTNTEPELTGTFVIQGEILHPESACPLIYKLANNGNLAAVEDKKAVFLHNKGTGSLCYYVSFNEVSSLFRDRNIDLKNIPAVRVFLEEMFTGWDKSYMEMFRATNEFTGFPLNVFPLKQSWNPHNNITLIGDAAHVMPPFGGNGVNIGLLDALNLTENLTNGEFSDIQSAIDDYEKKMFAYAAPVQLGAMEADKRIHSQTENAFKRVEKMMQERRKQK
ncbi:FAD-dependent oxidoreductase [Dyadobacter frigoris]|uniref:Flavin-dependent monooxygenase n=1 Tax=Dyadobacter frigoris TaxID=2576211 RepID=A0A4U6D5Z4_9BACT|nr:NAD(P)/FAD-dependent oxidoreductase [Dyadobacter frigoris]TKT92800.1 FAD-dependent monooxygenase [Dyadobacter frigoris]GLU54491.1 tetracycline resistance protein [Dyadobacter frigoris]